MLASSTLAVRLVRMWSQSGPWFTMGSVSGGPAWAASWRRRAISSDRTPENPVCRRVSPAGLYCRVEGGAVLVAEAPGETVVLAFADPVDLVGHIDVRTVLGGEQLALGVERHVERIARPVGVEVRLERGLVVRQHEVVRARGHLEDGRGERDLPAACFDLAVVRSRAAAEKDRHVVGAHDDPGELVVEVGAARGIAGAVDQRGPRPRSRRPIPCG